MREYLTERDFFVPQRAGVPNTGESRYPYFDSNVERMTRVWPNGSETCNVERMTRVWPMVQKHSYIIGMYVITQNGKEKRFVSSKARFRMNGSEKIRYV